ncbi:MAG TPA: trimethylamine--corrinoid methyltransferase [Chloroflexi bacterium]|nr:trimethylamine--corrinoid methyltransferase [Chloroflexota bacterium]
MLTLTDWGEVLSPGDIQKIHDTSMRIMANIGVRFPDDEALDTFKAHGFKTDGQIVYLEEKAVMEALETVPEQFTILARNPERSVTVGDGQSVFAPGYGAPFLVDYEVGKREPTMADYHDLVRLAHALPNQDLSGHLLVEPQDVPSPHLAMLHAHMLHSDKPFIGSATGRLGAQHTMEMAAILFGEDVVRENCVTISLINSLTPLGYSDEMLGALMEFARRRQPLVIAALAMCGSTGPVTLAGTLALQTAELLAGIVLTQLVSPGTPAVFGSTSTNIDMRTGALAIGSPELSLMIAAHAQLARHYGLPCRSGGSLADANTPDAQAGYESMMALLTTVTSGVDFVLHAGGILNAYLAFSYEKFVLDDEMCGMVRRFRRGIEVTPDTLAYDVVEKVGSGGNFLMEMHTVERCRTEFWTPTLSDRAGLDAWMESGRETALDRANRRWKKLLEKHQDPPLDDVIARQLETFVEEHVT